MRGFATIKKHPRQRTLTRVVDYRSRIIAATVMNVFRTSVMSLSEILILTSKYTDNHLLSVESGTGSRKPVPNSAHVSSPPRKKALSVYMGAA
jgi:hypothetical protein